MFLGAIPFFGGGVSRGLGASATQAAFSAVYDSFTELHVTSAQNLSVRSQREIELAAQSPSISVATDNGSLLAIQGRIYEPTHNPYPAVYQTPRSMSLRKIVLTDCKRILLETNLFINSLWVPFELHLRNSREITLRNQKYGDLHVYMEDNSVLRLENVCIDNIKFIFRGTERSVVNGSFSVRRRMQLWSQVRGCSVGNVTLEEGAQTVPEEGSSFAVEVAAVSSAPRLLAQTPASDNNNNNNNNGGTGVFPYYLPALQHTVQAPPCPVFSWSRTTAPPRPLTLHAPRPRRPPSSEIAPVAAAEDADDSSFEGFPPRVATSNEPKCTICFVNYPNSFTNCNHQIFCSKCLPQARRKLQRRPDRPNEGAPCTLCRRSITDVVTFEPPDLKDTQQQQRINSNELNSGSHSPKPIACGGSGLNE